MKLLYDAYPDSTKIDENNPKRNLIHNGLYNEVDKNMMKFLCANYPDALHGYSQDRYDRQEIAISVKQIPRRISPSLFAKSGFFLIAVSTISYNPFLM